VPVLHRDFETRSTIDLPDVGAWRYAADPTTDVWCVAYAVDDGPVKLWLPGQPIPDEFHIAARDPDWIVVAHNDAFETAIEQRILAPRYGWPIVPIERHRCTMAMAAASALPAKLKTVAEVLELSARKDDDGSRLMKQLARAGNGNAEPDKLDRLYAYCRQDVEVERELFHRLPPLTDDEQALWVLDQIINQRGFYTDGPLLDASSRIAAEAGQATQNELARITDGALTSTDQVAAMLTWLEEHGCKIQDLKKPTLGHALRRKELDPIVGRVIELRIGAAHAAAAKIDALRAWRDDDGRVRGTLRFHGAGTGRWTGSGPQPQNFKRDSDGIEAKRVAISTGDLGHVQKLYPQPLEVVGDIARAMICAAPGHRFLIGDFSGIESRVLAWVSGQQSKLDMWSKFDQTGSPADEPYFMIGRGCGRPEDSARAIGKTADLAFGYMGGPGAWDRLAPDDDTSTQDDKKRYQNAWRRLHPQTVKFWGGINRAAIQAVRNKGVAFTCRRLTFIYDGEFLRITLPSGRALSYPSPRMSVDKFGNSIVIFKDSAGGKFVDCRFGQGAYGGLWAENIVQAVSRDLLAAAMQRLEAAGYSIVLHVHDEVVAEAPIEFGNLDEFTRLITALPDWAEGLPVAAKVRNGPRFAKSEKPAAVVAAVAAVVEMPAAAEIPPWEDEAVQEEKPAAPEAVDDIVIIDMPHIDIRKILAAPTLVPDVAPQARKANGHDREYSDGSRAEAARDTHAEDNAGKPFNDAFMRTQGYRLAKVFDYTLPDGTVLYQQNRYELRDGIPPTSKRPRKRFLPHQGGILGAGERKVIYNWPAIVRAGPGSTVFVTEGEKNADALINAGLLATTVLSHKWTPECAAALTGYEVIILEDYDDDGHKQSAIAHKTLAGGAASIRIVPTAHLWKHLDRGCRDIQAKDDVENWIELGGDPKKLVDICREVQADGTRLVFIDMSRWDFETAPEQEWAVYNRIPLRQCALFSGEGGAGKSLTQLHLSVATVLEREWLGVVPEQGRALFVDAEDDEKVLHFRLKAIAAHYDTDITTMIKGGLHLVSWVGCDSTLATVTRNGKIEATPLYQQLLETAGDIKPRMIGIAAAANVFAGNENDRSQVQQFVGLLTRVAMVANGSLVLISHPSLTGITSESGLSGSTQWHNSVRARSLLRGVKPEAGEPVDHDLREIVFKKNNYGPVSESIKLHWDSGLFLPVAGDALDLAAREEIARDVFMSLLKRFHSANRNLSDKFSVSYAPTVFAGEDEAKQAGLTKKNLANAMAQLFKDKVIWNEPCGRATRSGFRLALK
jgi:DNA polymerase